jgi:hypothetical protein
MKRHASQIAASAKFRASFHCNVDCTWCTNAEHLRFCIPCLGCEVGLPMFSRAARLTYSSSCWNFLFGVGLRVIPAVNARHSALLFL